MVDFLRSAAKEKYREAHRNAIAAKLLKATEESTPRGDDAIPFPFHLQTATNSITNRYGCVCPFAGLWLCTA